MSENKKLWILVKPSNNDSQLIAQVEKMQEMLETEAFKDSVIEYGYEIEREEEQENERV